MAEHDPAHTTAPPDPADHEPTPPDPDETLEFPPGLSRQERIQALSSHIGADATDEGFHDIQGLNLTVTGSDGYSERFVVIDASTRWVHEPVERRKPFSRPRIQGPLIVKKEDVTVNPGQKLGIFQSVDKPAFRQLRETSLYRNVGGLRLARRGGSSIDIDRRRELVDPVEEDFVTVEAYGTDGNLTGVKTMRLGELYETAADALANGEGERRPKATWNWDAREESGPHIIGDEIEIDLTGSRKPVFEEISEQLESQDITRWTGLAWTLDVPHDDDVPHDRGRHGQAGSLRYITQEVISDEAVKEINYGGAGYRQTRRFLVRTVEHYQYGLTVITGDQSFSDYELVNYLEKPDDFNSLPKGTNFRDVHMTEASRRRSEDLTLPNPADIGGVYGLPEHYTLDEAMMILSYPELYDLTTEEGRAEHEEEIKRLAEGGGKKYGVELQQALSEVGVDYFHAVVDKIHSGVLKRAKQLGLEMDPDDEASASWVAEDLMWRCLDARRGEDDSPFGDIIGEPHFLRDAIDEHLGEIVGELAVKRKTVPIRGEPDEDGKPKIEKKTFREFNGELFETLPYTKSPGATMGVKKWRDKVWAPIEELAQRMYKYEVYSEAPDDWEGDPPDPVTMRDYRELGRRLSRTIGE